MLLLVEVFATEQRLLLIITMFIIFFDIDVVMGHVIKNGLDVLGTSRTTKLDPSFEEEIKTMVNLLESPSISEREKKHVNAIKLWSEGCVSFTHNVKSN